MILQALCEYYRRKAAMKSAVEETEIAPLGFEKKEISHVIVLRPNGDFLQLNDMREMDNKKKRGKIYLVPKSVKRTAGILSNLLWDNPGYVLGIDIKDTLIPSPEKQQAFIDRIKQILNSDVEGDTSAISAVLTFLESKNYTALFETSEWQDLVASKGKPSINLTFRITGQSELVCDGERVLAYIEQTTKKSEKGQICLVSGEKDDIERIHPSIKGVWGAQSSGADIVSFNFDAAEFYGKKQGENAPIGKKSAFAYTTALNHLLNSKQRTQIGDASTVFWSEQQSHMEDIFGNILKDDPDRNTEKVKALFNTLHTGAWLEDNQEVNHFYVLGLAPNASRIVVRFWHVTTVKQLACHIQQYFTDMQMIHGDHEDNYLPFWKIQAALSIQNDKKSHEKTASICEQLLKSILTGAPLTYAILAALIIRIGAERNVNYPRAALLKIWLNRDARQRKSFSSLNSSQEEITMALDETNTQLGYRLGRLFAVLEKIQEEVKGKNIRERFYRAASSTPLMIFPHLFSLKNYHITKLENPGRAVNLEKSIGEIMSGIPADLPAMLDLKDQARFAIGYYHQRQHFFMKNPEKNNPILSSEGVEA